jgi:hypothetical protein
MFARGMTFARRQQYRHRVRSDGYLLCGVLVLLVGLSASRIRGDALMVFALLLLGGALFWGARRSQRVADRWRVGADAERAVQHALSGLADSGWVVRNGVRWPGGGDIDHLVRSPAGVGFAIETKCADVLRGASAPNRRDCALGRTPPETLSVRGVAGGVRRARASA